MNDETTNLDQIEEDVLTYTASDEALEAAAGPERGIAERTVHMSYPTYLCCYGRRFSLSSRTRFPGTVGPRPYSFR